MKARFCLVAMVFVLGCSSAPTKYPAEAYTWKGRDAELLTRSWGKPDAVEKLSQGRKMYVYARLKNEPVAYNDAQRALASSEPSHLRNDLYIHCSAYFEIDAEGKIVSSLFRGDDCK